MLVIHQEDVQALRQSRRAAKDPKRTKQATAVLELARGRSLPEVSRKLDTSEDEVMHLIFRYTPIRERSRRQKYGRKKRRGGLIVTTDDGPFVSIETVTASAELADKIRLSRPRLHSLDGRLVLLVRGNEPTERKARIPMPSYEEFMALGVPNYEAVGADLDADPADLIDVEEWFGATR